MKRAITILIIFLVCNPLFPQVTETKGNLLRINFTQTGVDLDDTLWNWTSTNYVKGESCSNIINIDSTLYLLINSYDNDPQLPWNYLYLYNTVKKTKELLIADHPPLDPMDPYFYYRPIINYANSGCWIFNGIRYPAYYLRNDSLYNFDGDRELYLIHSSGKLGDKNLFVFNNRNVYDFFYYLEDLSGSPGLKFTDKIDVYDENDILNNYLAPSEVHHLSDSLYLVREMSENFYLASFTGHRLKFIKSLKPEDSQSLFVIYKFSNNNLFTVENNKLFREIYNPDSVKFVNKEIIVDSIGDVYAFSDDNNFFAHILNDSLFVYSLNQSELINGYSLGTINIWGNIIVDSPYVYLHQINTVTGTKANTDIPVEFKLDQNYPNPFNPTTSIGYQLPTAGHVTLKVYDILGREIATLVDEDQTPGKYSSNFGAQQSSLGSGVYFYRLKANNYLEVKKMMLLK